jgi:hypothetical protein
MYIRKLEELITNKDLREKFGRAAMIKMRQFRKEEIAMDYLKFIQNK